MSSSIEQGPRPETEFSRSFVITMVTLTICTLVLFSFSPEKEREPYDDSVRIHLAWAPYSTAAGNILSQGLSEFSSARTRPVQEDARTIILVGLVLFYVLFPTVFLFAWRSRSIAGSVAGAKVQEGGMYAMYLVTGICCALMLIGTLGSSISQRLRFQSMQHAQAIQANKDNIINAVNTISIRLREYRALPASFGGGEGSYEGFSLPAAFASHTDASFSLETKPDTVILHAASVLYGGANVTVGYSPVGLRNWTYEGDFR